MIEDGDIFSMIFWGPPGVGKTTLAHLIADHLKRPFYTLSAISSGVKDVREVIQKVEGEIKHTHEHNLKQFENHKQLKAKYESELFEQLKSNKPTIELKVNNDNVYEKAK